MAECNTSLLITVVNNCELVNLHIVANGGVCCPERWAVRSLHLVGLLNV